MSAVSIVRVPVIACVVEGHGEDEALPVLIRRITRMLEPPIYPVIPSPLRVGKDRLIKAGELERTVDLAARKVRSAGPEGSGGVLVLIDADDHCPAELGPALARRARDASGDVAASVVLAKREFEAWFLAGAASLRGKRGLSEDIEPPTAPEEVRGAKEWLGKHMVSSRIYSPTVDQPGLTEALDLDATRLGSPSFARCWREIVRLVSGPVS
ncbi:MAG: DUF4276 family protein [Acidimicrobiales bacterium]